jgi:hypothetical protein
MMLYSVIFLLSACGGGTPVSDLGSDVGVIGYRSAHIYEPNSDVNKLLIAVNSRITVNESVLQNPWNPRESLILG